jgi:hypothetical protein
VFCYADNLSERREFSQKNFANKGSGNADFFVGICEGVGFSLHEMVCKPHGIKVFKKIGFTGNFTNVGVGRNLSELMSGVGGGALRK